MRQAGEVRAAVATIDFHVTSECSQSCPYCWGPTSFEHPVDTETARRIVTRVREVGARRIVFTGGDPLQREDIGALLHHAREIGLEVALSTTGDKLTAELLREHAADLDLVSLPLDGASEGVNRRTKEKGHFASVLHALDLLRAHPSIDVKMCTPVTSHNLTDVPRILELAERYAETTRARVFYNIFQAYPRAMEPREWEELLVTDEQFTSLKQALVPRRVKVNLLDHATLDRLYLMVFPDGSLVIPSGSRFVGYGPFLEIEDLRAVIAASDFDAPKHRRHSRGWSKRGGPSPS